jgi:acyl-coenzyme A thioesterase PaaI-like protein
MTLSPPGTAVLTVEYKVNFMVPARGGRMLARARVLRPGRSFTVCAGDVHAENAAGESHIATMIATIANVVGRPDLAE